MFGCGRGGIIRTKNNAAKQKITQNIFTDNLQKQKRGTNHTLLYLAGDVGLEPTHAGFRIRCLNQLGESPKLVGVWKLAGDVGFEPTNAGIKIRCLNQLGESPKSCGVLWLGM